MTDTTDLDPSSRLIIEEARRRGIAVEIEAPRAEYFRLRHGARAIRCRESLSELTSAVALSRCDDKRVTARLLGAAGLSTPAQMEAGDTAHELAFLREHGQLVVKPARGEQGRGVCVGIRTPDALVAAIERAALIGGSVQGLLRKLDLEAKLLSQLFDDHFTGDQFVFEQHMRKRSARSPRVAKAANTKGPA